MHNCETECLYLRIKYFVPENFINEAILYFKNVQNIIHYNEWLHYIFLIIKNVINHKFQYHLAANLLWYFEKNLQNYRFL